MPAIQGLRGTGQFDTDHRPTNYRELFTLLEPNGDAPLNALLAMGQSEETDDPKYNNFRDELPERVMVNVGAAAAGVTALTITNADDNKFAIKDAIVVNATTGEVMRVTADVTATTLNVTRNIGGTAFAVADQDRLFVAGHAAPENGTTPTAISFDATIAFNYTQIFKTAFGLSNTLKNTTLRTGSKEDEAQEKALKLHMGDIERAMFFGRRFIENPNTASPTRFTGGLLTTLSQVIDLASDFSYSNAADANRMDEAGFDRLLIESLFKYGSKTKIAFVGARVAGHLQAFGKARWQPTQVDDTYGVKFTRYTTPAGDLLIHLHPQFRMLPQMRDAMVVVDFPYLSYRHMKGRDTSLLENRQGNNQDGVIHEYLTECGLELLQDKVHAYIRNWTKR